MTHPSSLPLLSEEFPYLITRVVPSMYHIIPLPDALSEEELLILAKKQIVANKLQTCLALNDNRGYFLEPRSNQSPAPTDFIARGGLPVCDQLRAVPDIEYAPFIGEKIQRLQEKFQQQVRTGFTFGDLTKGNRPATREDIRRLSGSHNGIPVGLELCDTCRDYRGECLDSGKNFQGTVATVHCKCENDNQCAFCNELLTDRRLNANYFNPKNGTIWHVPGFTGFDHQCQR